MNTHPLVYNDQSEMQLPEGDLGALLALPRFDAALLRLAAGDWRFLADELLLADELDLADLVGARPCLGDLLRARSAMLT